MKHIFGWIGFRITVPWNISLAKNSPNRTEPKEKMCVWAEKINCYCRSFYFSELKNFNSFVTFEFSSLFCWIYFSFIYSLFKRKKMKNCLDIHSKVWKENEFSLCYVQGIFFICHIANFNEYIFCVNFKI